MKFKISNSLSRLSATVVATMMAVQANAAGTDLGSISSSIATNVSAVAGVISNASFVGGAGLVVAGCLKLKAHAENPGQTPLGHGAGRIACGAMLVAAPAITQFALNTFSSDASTAGIGSISNSTNRFN